MSQFFSEKFRNLRKVSNLTQEEIANIFHVSPQTVSRWETGVNYPDVDMLPHIAIYFKVTIDELLGTEAIRGAEDVKILTRDIRNLLNDGKLVEAIETARKATKKYPLDTGLHYHLVQALSAADKTLESAGMYKEEIISISERIIGFTDYKSSLGHRVQLVRQYAEWGMKEEAKRILDTLPTEIWDSKEPWIGLVLEGDEWRKNQQHRIIRAMYLLEYLIAGFLSKADLSTMQKITYHKTKMQIESLINTIAYDNVEDSINHLELAFEEIIIAELYAELQDTDNTLEYVNKAAQNSMYHINQMDKTSEDGGNYMSWPTSRNLPWILWEDHLIKPQFDFVRSDERFIKCFDLLKSNSKMLGESSGCAS